MNFSLAKRLRSFVYAFNGVFYVMKSQHNAWIHALFTVLVCIAGWYFRFTRIEWCFIVFAIVLVWVAEAINTAFEFLADVLSPKHNPLVGKAKDIAAAAVLISAIGSVIIGFLIIGPYFWKLLAK